MLLKRILPAVSLAVIATTTLVGCGGDGRPSANDVSAAYQKSDTTATEEQGDCLGKVVYESDLSDEAVTTIVEDIDNAEPADLDKKDQEVIESADFTTEVGKCLLLGVDVPTEEDMPDLELPEGMETTELPDVTPAE